MRRQTTWLAERQPSQSPPRGNISRIVTFAYILWVWVDVFERQFNADAYTGERLYFCPLRDI